ncbi:8182_t:CDS:2, partial [Gigaspora margarita]
WIVNDVDISEICLKYREEVVKKCEPITVTLANKMSESFTIGQKCFDLILLSTKLDFVIKTTNSKKQIELLISEIKPLNKEDVFILDDLVSFRKTIKCAINKSIKDSIDDLVIYNLQIISK